MKSLARYELLSKIASGGMAEIWVARVRDPGGRRDLRARDMCVIKKLLPQHAEDEEFTRMFLEEGRIGAALVHPNIVRMFDFGTEGGTHYLAMEYLIGEDLRAVNRANRGEGKTMPLGVALDVIARACAGLHHAHELRDASGTPLEIVHRDVSPHNVFLTFDGGVKVVDFGIAKSASRRWETRHGTLKGKVPYMAPEQIKARKLDRRTDVYAMGVMLYEVIVGRRPYVLAAPGDFALMMAIARHDVRAPREVVPDLDPELEEIILRAIAYDPKARWQTMKELSTALERFSAARRLASGPRVLADYLAARFATRVQAWQAAQQEQLAALAVQIEEERAQSGLDEEDSDGSKTFAEQDGATIASGPPPAMAAPPMSASLVVSASSAVAAVIEIAGATVVTMQGRIDESFEGAALGGSLSGTVLFDLKGVERVTSFGVREWLEMMKAIDEQEDVDVWLVRCSDAVVNQLSLIRAFAGKSKILSIRAPFLCDDCGNAFGHVLDCERDAGWFREGRGPCPRCARCGGPTKLDDDPSFLAFAAAHAGRAVPARLREVLETIEQTDRVDADAVDKIVTNEETRVRVHRDVDRSVRWRRVLDGIEGRLVIDFRGAPRVNAEGAENLVRALKALGPEVTDVEILECPAPIVAALGPRRVNERPRIRTVAFTGRCPACAATRAGVVPMSEVLEAESAGRPPAVPCRRCNARIDVDDPGSVPADRFPFAPSSGSIVSGATSLGGATLPTPSSARALEAVPPDEPPRSVAAGAARPRPVRSLVVAAVAGVSLAMIVIAVLHARLDAGGSANAAGPASAASAAPVVPESSAAPAPVDRPSAEITPSGVELSVVLRGASATERDLARARSRAIAAAVERLALALPADVREANAAAGEGDAAESAIDERYTRDVGAFAGPERTDVHVGVESGEPSLSARYRIPRSAWERAVAYYAETREVQGLKLARALPTRRDGLVLVAVDQARYEGLERGAVMVELDERPVVARDGLDRLTRMASRDTSSRGHAGVFVVRNASVTVKLK